MSMNQYDVEDAMQWFDEEEQANLIHGARVLYRLMRWTNSCSDGWAYWRKPSAAAKKLMGLLEAGREGNRRNYGDLTDCTEAELKAAFTPIKSFLTRNGTAHSEVFYLNG